MIGHDRSLSDTIKIVRYWHKSLAQAELMGAKEIDITDEELIEQKSISQGKISASVVSRLFEDGFNSYVPVIIAPFVAQRRYQYGRQSSVDRKKAIAPLWIPALLQEDGKLWPASDNPYPWICRDLLEPTNSDVVIGMVENLDDYFDREFVAKNERGEITWKELLEYGKELLAAVSGERWETILEAANYKCLEEGLIKMERVPKGVSTNILKVYDHLIAHPISLPLLSAYTSLNSIDRQPIFSEKQSIDCSQQHLGHVSSQYPLSPSQREAISHIFQVKAGEILAINGPPGTGKTTLLHDIIASNWVKAALEETNPPVIVVSSTNNQAVTNVLDSFNRVAFEVNRWLPDLESYGLFLCSTRQQNRAVSQGYHWITQGYGRASGFTRQVENYEYLKKAKLYFIKNCQQQLSSKIQTIEQAISCLHEQITITHSLMLDVLDKAENCLENKEAIDSKYREYEGIETYLENLEQNQTELNIELEYLRKLDREWEAFQKQEPWWMRWFGFIPLVRHRRQTRLNTFINRHPQFLAENKSFSITDRIDRQFQVIKKQVSQYQYLRQKADKDWQEYQQISIKWQELCSQLNGVELDFSKLLVWETETGEPESANLLNYLDSSLRFQLFELATHYWEARWLLEVDRLNFYRRENQDPAGKRAYWERLAMLTPCLVTTMYSGPKFFNCYEYRPNKPKEYPHYQCIDLLIVDEAGQVSPDVAGAMFALAKKAIAVGDRQQIEPIWNIPLGIDYLNACKYDLVQTAAEFEDLKATGILVSSGSVMQIAQQQSRYQKISSDGKPYEPGMFLAEHRRCVPEIISYCNQLAYEGRLISRRDAEKIYSWSIFEHFDVRGYSYKIAGSRANEEEAQAIVEWLRDRHDEILQRGSDRYGSVCLSDLVGIVTPFRQQKIVLRKLLDEADLDIEKVGTVHALQGAERSLIIFSSVYTVKDRGTYFFDRSVNMLNVAVSRAKDSFLCFGDRRILNPQINSPSGILAQCFLAAPD
ncbi:MAG: AAA family ATPase [Cyanosarcina radialis HA8281-LM2]|jgi:energy-coupling factor transporter ATP-binding protein EcfA2|nr:AAA family ATPase [Cyanosarcina radialis HA8281-LM2]